MNLSPLPPAYRDHLALKTAFGRSHEAGLKQDAYSLKLSGWFEAISFGVEESYGDPRFGEMAGSSLTRDYSGRTVTFDYSALNGRFSLFTGFTRSQDNVARQKVRTQTDESFDQSLRLEFFEGASLALTYGRRNQYDTLRTVDRRSQDCSLQVDYDRDPWSLSGSYGQTFDKDILTRTATRTTSGRIETAISPDPSVRLAYAFSPVRTSTPNLGGAIGTKISSDDHYFSGRFRFWKRAANLDLSFRSVRSFDSANTLNSRDNTYQGSLSYTPRLYSPLKPSLKAGFLCMESLDRLTSDRTRTETLDASLYMDF